MCFTGLKSGQTDPPLAMKALEVVGNTSTEESMDPTDEVISSDQGLGVEGSQIWTKSSCGGTNHQGGVVPMGDPLRC